jgi:hypothetical protein
MHYRRVLLLAACVIAGTTAAGARGPAAESIELAITPAFATEPAGVRIVVTLEPHPDNRSLVVSADSPSYFRSTRRQIDGELAARRHTVVLTDLPAGDYVISARVAGVDGIRAFDERDFMVLSRDGERWGDRGEHEDSGGMSSH